MAEFYPKKIGEKFRAAKNVGAAANANAVGTSAAVACGAALRLSLRIEKSAKKIAEAKFKTNGCGFVVAAAEVLSEQIVGKKLGELHSLDRNLLQTAIETELGEFPGNRRHCLDLCLETLQTAFADFRICQIEEFTGEKALICTCFSVSEETIENLIETKSLETVEEVTDVCSAGGGCGSCQPLIEDILETYRRGRF